MGSSAHDDADDPIVVLSDVRRRFGEQGLHGLDLQVPSGTIAGLVGPSGSGKTTAVRIVLGLDEPEEGSVFVFGRRPTDFSKDDRRRIGYMPQSVALYPELSLQHNLNLLASLYGMPWRGRWIPGKGRRRARARVADTLAFLGLTDQKRTKLADASGGEQRRLALAAAMIHRPSLLVLDEPTAGIDPVLRREIWGRLGELRDDGTTVFVTTQYVEEATHCDLVTVLADGEALVTDSPDGLRHRAFGDDPAADASFEDVFVQLIRRHEDERRSGSSARSDRARGRADA